MGITVLSSNDEVLAELGARIRAARIDMPLTQEELAKRAGVSLSMVARLERGQDVRLGNVVSVLRALGLLANLDSLVPAVLARPTDIVSLGHARRRASSPNRRGRDAQTWKWGDER